MPVVVAHLIERMQVALAAGWVLPKIAIARVPQQLEEQTHSDPEKSPEYAPSKSFPADMAPADRERLALAGRQVIPDKVVPAFRSLSGGRPTRGPITVTSPPRPGRRPTQEPTAQRVFHGRGSGGSRRPYQSAKPLILGIRFLISEIVCVVT